MHSCVGVDQVNKREKKEGPGLTDIITHEETESRFIKVENDPVVIFFHTTHDTHACDPTY
ncbi:hypothetical protein EAE99_010364 [Botrytis elliptica]|nr:hypothetical protein EAE99_010364 [Botrytis elliptica]